MTNIYTPNRDAYDTLWLTVPDRTYKVFRIKACSDAKVALSQFVGNTATHSYEVVYGATSNSRTVLRKYSLGVSTEVATGPSPNVLNCELPDFFWVSWENGFIAAGRGLHPGEDGFVGYRDPQPYEVNALGFAGRASVWGFGTLDGKQFLIHLQLAIKLQILLRKGHKIDGSNFFGPKAKNFCFKVLQKVSYVMFS